MLLWQVISVHFSQLQSTCSKPLKLNHEGDLTVHHLNSYWFFVSPTPPSLIFLLKKHCSWKRLWLHHLNADCKCNSILLDIYRAYTTQDLRTTAQNTILDTLRIVIASLIKLFSVTQWLYYPCTCLPPQWDLQRLIYIQYKFYTSNLSQTKFKLFFFESSCNWNNTRFCNFFLPSWGQCIKVEARHFEWLNSTQFVYPYWRQKQSRYKKSTCYRFDSKYYWSLANRNYQCEGGKVFWASNQDREKMTGWG